MSGPPTPADAPANAWRKVARGVPVWRDGAAMVFVPDVGRMLLLGGYTRAKNAPYVQAFDPASMKWATYSQAGPTVEMYPSYRAAYDAGGERVYCLSQALPGRGRYLLPEGRLYSFALGSGTWKQHGRSPALQDMDWHTMALDPERRRLVVVGADKRADNVGWSRTVVHDIGSGKWTRLPLPAEDVVKQHKELVAAKEALIDLIGRTRLAWYRDPKGVGTAAELRELRERCTAVGKMPGMAGFQRDLGAYAKLISVKKTLDALKAARGLQREVEARAEARYPVPPSRRNSPLVYDAKNKVFVLFGGDHGDYLTNDTWILDLEKGWRRAAPANAPSPRAGHVLVYLPASGKVLLYGGYMQGSSMNYDNSARNSYQAVVPYQVWLYDVASNRWDLLTSWTPKRGETRRPSYFGAYYGYVSKYGPAPLVADGSDTLYLASKTAVWRMAVEPGKCDPSGTKKMAAAPNQRQYRKGAFLASYCEVPQRPKGTGLDDLPANRFVKLPDPPRNVCYGCRGRPWGTALWDPHRDQVLAWGGGHCVRSENPPIHYSPVSGRMVEGYDAQEAYSYGGAYGATTLNRPWVPGHSWNMYAYDPPSRLMVIHFGYLYDPSRMDWRRDGPVKPPFATGYHTILESSPRGAVAWARTKQSSDKAGIWLFDAKKGWVELAKPGGAIPLPLVDNAGMVYDPKRDRLLLVTTPWGKPGDGSLTAFYFKDRRLEKVTPANADLGKVNRAREMAYVGHADWVLSGESCPAGKGKDAAEYVRAYDCSGNRWILLKIDGFPSGSWNSQGWLYDAKRKLVYVVNSNRWAVWALRLDPQTVGVLTDEP